MKITIESTTKIVTLNGIPARVWEGETDSGVRVHAYVTRIAIDESTGPQATAEFERELSACKPPSAKIAAIPLCLVL